MDIGLRLQSIRRRKGLSQRELAKRAGVTNSTISMIEKNSVSPSISSLKKVLSGIPMTLVEFFSHDATPEKAAKVIYTQDELTDISSGAVIMRLVGPGSADRALAFLDETYPPGADTGLESYSHDGEEAGILISGRLELTVDEDVFILNAGDSYYFDSSRPHRFRNPFDSAARLISATTPANF